MRKLTHFDGLRGLAAFVVFLAHFRPAFCHDINQRFLDWVGLTGGNGRLIAENLISLLYEGALPVFIFWLMSAYVISIKLFDPVKNDNNKYLVEAATKRYFRLAIPVFAASLVCFVLLKANLLYNAALAKGLNSAAHEDWLMQQ